jgi:hypothetical protein
MSQVAASLFPGTVRGCRRISSRHCKITSLTRSELRVFPRIVRLLVVFEQERNKLALSALWVSASASGLLVRARRGALARPLSLAQCSPLWLALLPVLALGRRPRKSSHLIAVIGLRSHRLPQRRGLICRQRLKRATIAPLAVRICRRRFRRGWPYVTGHSAQGAYVHDRP